MARKKRNFHLLIHVPLFPVVHVFGKFAVADLVNDYHAVGRQIGNFDVKGAMSCKRPVEDVREMATTSLI